VEKADDAAVQRSRRDAAERAKQERSKKQLEEERARLAAEEAGGEKKDARGEGVGAGEEEGEDEEEREKDKQEKEKIEWRGEERGAVEASAGPLLSKILALGAGDDGNGKGDGNGDGDGGDSVEGSGSVVSLVSVAAAAPPPKSRPGYAWTAPTTSMILIKPLAESGFTVMGLSAETNYRFRVKCVSAAGGSSFGPMVEAHTLPAVAPGPCLFVSQDLEVKLKDPTTTMALRWMAPSETGGADIVEYEIAYDLQVIKAKVTDVR